MNHTSLAELDHLCLKGVPTENLTAGGTWFQQLQTLKSPIFWEHEIQADLRLETRVIQA